MKEEMKNKRIDFEKLEDILQLEEIIKQDSHFSLTGKGLEETSFNTSSLEYKVKQEHLKDMFGDDFVCHEDEIFNITYGGLPELKEKTLEEIFKKEE